MREEREREREGGRGKEERERGAYGWLVIGRVANTLNGNLSSLKLCII